MSTHGKVELSVATALFIALGSGTTIARGHIAGDLFVVAFAALLAAILTVLARRASERAR